MYSTMAGHVGTITGAKCHRRRLTCARLLSRNRGAACLVSRAREVVMSRGSRRTMSSSDSHTSTRLHASVMLDVLLQSRPNPNTALGDVARASDVVRSLFEAVNERNFGDVMELIANDCQYHGLAFSQVSTGKLAVAKMYMDLVNHLPDDVAFAVEDITEGDPTRAGVTWHIEVEGVEVPGTRGVSFLRLDPTGRVAYIREGPEHPLKLAPLGLPALGLASNVVRSMGTTAVALTGVAELLEQVVHNTPLQPLATFLISPLLNSSATPPSSPPPEFHLPNPLTTLTSVAGSIIPQPPPGPAPTPSHPSHAATVTPAPSYYTPPHMQDHAPAPSHAYGASTSAPARPPHEASPPNMHHTSAEGYPGPIRGAASRQGLFAAAATSSYPTPASPLAASTPQALFDAAAAASASSHAISRLQQQSAALPSAPAAAAAAVAEGSGMMQPGALPVEALVLELSGVWEKDMQESQLDAYEKCLDVWGISGMQKLTARLIEGLELEDRRQEGGRFTVNHLTIIPQFKATEAFTLGQATRIRRRVFSAAERCQNHAGVNDMRPGAATGTLVEIPGGVRAVQEWAKPFAGRLEEEYTLRDDGKMSVVSRIAVGDRSAEVLQVFVRRGLDRKEFLRLSEQRNGSSQEWVSKFIRML